MPFSSPSRMRIVAHELFKAFTSIKRLAFHKKLTDYLAVTLAMNTSFMEDVTTLDCDSDLDRLFTQLSGCRNLRSLIVKAKSHTSGELGNFISAQQNLEHLHIYGTNNLKGIIPSIKDLSNTLIKLKLDIPKVLWKPLTFLSGMKLQVLILVFKDDGNFKTFQDVTLPQLRVLKLQDKCPSRERMVGFLEKNGGNLETLDIKNMNGLSDSDIIILCPNLKSLNNIMTVQFYFKSKKFFEV
jgi:hypothetical protein